MPLNDYGKAGMTFWGPIAASVNSRAGTSELWAAIRASVADTDGQVPLPSLQAVNNLRSLAASMRNARANLQAARDLEDESGLPQTLGAGMMAYSPWSRSLDQIATASNYLISYQATLIGPDGSEFSQWLSARYSGGTLPETVGDLIDDLGAIAVRSGSLEQGDFSDIGDVLVSPI